MKLGKKGGKSNDLLDVLGSEAVVPQEEATGASPPVSAAAAIPQAQNPPVAQMSATTVLPKVDKERCDVCADVREPAEANTCLLCGFAAST